MLAHLYLTATAAIGLAAGLKQKAGPVDTLLMATTAPILLPPAVAYVVVISVFEQ